MAGPIALIAAAIPIVGGTAIRMVAPALLKELGRKYLTRATAAQVRQAGKNIPTATKSQVISQSAVNVAKSRGKLPGRQGERSTPSLRKPTISREEKIARQLAKEGKTPRKPDTGYRVGKTKELTGTNLKFRGRSSQEASDSAAMNPAYKQATGRIREYARGGKVSAKKYAYGGRVAKYKG